MFQFSINRASALPLSIERIRQMAGPFDPPYDSQPRRGLGTPQPAPTPSSVETITVVGASGTSYVFEVDPMGTAYHERPGVYMMLGKLPDGRWGIAYIGETDNFD